MIAAGWTMFTRTTVSGPMHGYGDLAVLAELPVRRFLVTSGFRRLQESKVKALGIAHLFEAIHIDAIDEPGSQGKERIFRAILEDHGFKPEQVMVVGDNPDSEIAAGNRLGLTTVQILRPGVVRGTNASHYIFTLAELKTFLAHG
jgi:putative hydrolase of the HAD superfamily